MNYYDILLSKYLLKLEKEGITTDYYASLFARFLMKGE